MFESVLDQASGLRRLFKPRLMRVLPIVADAAPGDSAVFVLNLAAALARTGSTPIVLDAQRAQIASSSRGIAPRFELDDLIEGRCTVAQAVRRSVDGVAVLAAARGLGRVADDPQAAEAVFSAVASLEGGFDVALLHAPAACLGTLLHAQDVEAAMLCGPHDEDLTRTYAHLKALVNDHRMSRFRVVFEGFQSLAEVTARHQRLAQVAARFLDAAVVFGGSLARRPELDEAVREQRSVFSVAAQGPAARAFERIASGAHEWRLPAFAPDRQTIH